MDIPARPEDALSQPTRARLFSVLAELRRPVGTDELASRLDLHPNGVRVHLERLRDAGLVTRKRSRQPRGRPRDMWLISPDARPAGDPPAGYAQLGRWVARAIKLSGFVARDPPLAGCLVELRGEIAAQGLERLRDPPSS